MKIKVKTYLQNSFLLFQLSLCIFLCCLHNIWQLAKCADFIFCPFCFILLQNICNLESVKSKMQVKSETNTSVLYKYVLYLYMVLGKITIWQVFFTSIALKKKGGGEGRRKKVLNCSVEQKWPRCMTVSCQSIRKSLNIIELTCVTKIKIHIEIC